MQFCFLAVLFTLVLLLKPPKITQLIHNFPFDEIFLLIDLFFYYCETEPVGTIKYYGVVFGAVLPNQYTIKCGVEINN